MEDNSNAKQLRTMMNGYGLNQQVVEQTHREGHILDHVYINESQLMIKNHVISDTLGLTTDHFPIQIELPASNKQQKNQTMHYRKLKNVNMDHFRNDLVEV